MSTVPFVDLRAQYQAIKPEIDAAIAQVLESGQFVLGEQVEAFEKTFAAYCQARFAVGVNSGTSALHLALLAAGVGPGDEVITVPFTFVATVAAIHYVGARPVYVDIDPDTYTIDVGQIERAITPQTKAILPVHLYGQPADLEPIVEIARSRGLIVIEDAAQAHGAEYKGRRVGSIGDLGCFSFYPGKNLGAYGEAGAVTTDNPDYARRIGMLRDWGAERKYFHDLQGYNYRMGGIQGAILGVKMRYIEQWTNRRRAAAGRYNRLLSEIGIEPPLVAEHRRHVYHIYAVRVPERARVQARLDTDGIRTGIHYPIPVHLQRAYSDPRYRQGDFPIAEKAAAEVLSLPMYAEIPESNIEAVRTALRNAQSDGQ